MALFSHDSKADALARTALFRGLSRNSLRALAKVSEDVEVEQGTVLCREGDTAREFFVIVDGEAVVERGGRELRRLGAGDFFGEIALVDHSRRTATVTAATPLRFFVLTSQAFDSVLESEPEVERTVLRTLARRVLADSSDPTTES